MLLNVLVMQTSFASFLPLFSSVLFCPLVESNSHLCYSLYIVLHFKLLLPDLSSLPTRLIVLHATQNPRFGLRYVPDNVSSWPTLSTFYLRSSSCDRRRQLTKLRSPTINQNSLSIHPVSLPPTSLFTL